MDNLQKISGFVVTEHALEQMLARHIDISDIASCLEDGFYEATEQESVIRCTYFQKSLSIVLNTSHPKRIVTVMKRRLTDARCAKIVTDYYQGEIE